jgi:hypothetical protein
MLITCLLNLYFTVSQYIKNKLDANILLLRQNLGEIILDLFTVLMNHIWNFYRRKWKNLFFVEDKICQFHNITQNAKIYIE